jgi:hypothetical protein
LTGVKGESRGRNLISDPGGGVVLTECQGLTPRQYERLASEDVDRLTLDNFDDSVYGLAAPESYYGYETQEEFVETGTSAIEDPREYLRSATQKILSGVTQSSGKDLPEGVLDQLDNLGYT